MVLFRLALVSLLIAGISAADWSFSSPEWQEFSSEQAKATFTRSADTVSIETVRDRAVRLDHALAQDGDDSEPLIITCGLSANGDRVLNNAPIGINLGWPDAELFIGIQDKRGLKGVAFWQTSGTSGSADDTANLDPTAYLNYVRVVLTRRLIECSVSGDGLSWRRIKVLERSGGMAGGPIRVSLGAGWGGTDSLDRNTDRADGQSRGDQETARYAFTQFSVERLRAIVPADLLATYKRQESREATQDWLLADSFPKTWWIAGEFTGDKKGVGPEDGPFDPAKPAMYGSESEPWQENQIGVEAHQRLFILERRTKKKKDSAVYYAATVITLDRPKRLRFLYDGLASVTLYVNGRPISTDKTSKSETAEPDRLGALVDLPAGRNVVMLALRSSTRGGCAFIFRVEPGDPRYRVAVERRLAIDFPNDPEEVAAGFFEAARVWEEIGHPIAAIGVLEDILKNEDLSESAHEQAYLERTRLHAYLRDLDAVNADVQAVRDFWSAHAGVDEATVFRRAADLWSRIDQLPRAYAELTAALQVKTLSADRRYDLLLELVRLHLQAGDAEGSRAAVAAAAPLFAPESMDRAYAVLASGDAKLARTLAQSTEPQALRIAIGVLRAAGDLQGVGEVLQALAGREPVGIANDPQVTWAEQALLLNDRKSAEGAYRAALAGLAGQAQGSGKAETVEALRAKYLHTRLHAVAGVDALLAAHPQGSNANIGADTSITDWRVIGPFPNNDWQAYTKPPVNAEKTDGTGKDSGKEWTSTKRDQYDGETLDFTRLFRVDNHVAVCYREITSPAAGTAELSFGADDGAIVWLNGEKLFEDRVPRGVTPDSLKVNLAVKKGSNRLVIQVQNGGGDWGLQARIRFLGLAEMGIADALRLALEEKPAERAVVAAVLAKACGTGLEYGLNEAASGLTLAVLAAFPDQAAVLTPLARRFIDLGLARRFPDTARAALMWWDAHDRMGFMTGTSPLHMQDQRLAAAATLQELGFIADAHALLQPLPLTSASASSFSQALLGLGELYFQLGELDTTQRWLERCTAVRGGDSNAQRRSREVLASMRRIRTSGKAVTISLDAVTAAQSADRAAAAQDIEHAEQAFQQALRNGVGEVLPTTGGRYIGIAWRSIQRLQSLPAEAKVAYIAQVSRAAEAALQQALNNDDADALERVAAQWPIVPTGATALVEAAQRYRASGAHALATATVRLATDRFQLDKGLAAIAKGLDSDAESAAAPAVKTASASVPIGLPAATLFDLKRFGAEGSRPLHVPLQAAAGADVIAVHSGSEVVVVDAVTGRERWRVSCSAAGNPPSADRGQHVHAAVVIEGLVIGLNVMGAVPLLEARSVIDGSLRWASHARSDWGTFVPIASPATDGHRVIVLGTENDRGVLCALRPRDGALLWRTDLPVAVNGIAIRDGRDVDVGRVQGPPVLVGREIFISLDSGAVVSVDGPSGVVRWIATYPRGVFGAADSRHILSTLLDRAPNAIAVGADTVVVTPRDRLGVFAFARADGAARWYDGMNQARTVVPIGPVGKEDGVLLVFDESVQAIDPNTGRQLWQWRSKDGPIHGEPVRAGKAMLVGTMGGLHALQINNGTESSPFQGWRALGHVGSTPGHFLVIGERIAATSSAGLLLLAPGTPPAKPAVLIPTARLPAGPQPVAPVASGANGALGIAWRRGGDALVKVIQPDDPRADELFLWLRSGLICLSADLTTVAWHLQLPSDARDIAISGDQVLTVSDGTMVVFHREHAMIRWAESLMESPAQEYNDSWKLRAALGANLAVAYGHHQSWMVVRSARNGQQVWRGELRDQRTIWVGEVGADLVTLIAKGDKVLALQRRDPQNPSVVRSEVTAAFPVNDSVVNQVPGKPFLIVSGNAQAWVDLTTNEIHKLELEKGWPMEIEFQPDGIDLLTRNDNRLMYVVLDPKTGAVRLSKVYQDGSSRDEERFSRRYARIGDLLVRQHTIDRDATEMYGTDLQDKERFRVAGDHKDQVRPILTVGLGAAGFHTLSEPNGRQVVRRIHADGTVSAESMLPVALPEGVLRYEVIGDKLILNGTNEVVILRAQGEPKDVAKDAPIAIQDLRARIGIAEHPPRLTRFLEQAPVIDGHLDEWPREFTNEVDAHGIRAIARGASASSASAPPGLRWWSGYTEQSLVIAAEVDTAMPALVGIGLPPGDSPGLLVGVAPLDEGKEGLTAILHVGVRDGQSQWRLVDGAFASTFEVQDAGQVQTRVAVGADTTRYEIAIPWAWLRRKADQRPGDKRWIRIDVAAVLPQLGAAREAGFGMIDGAGGQWWVPSELKR